jgi:hypothetical protein
VKDVLINGRLEKKDVTTQSMPCPKCKSPYWDQPRKIEKKKHDLNFKDKKN